MEEKRNYEIVKEEALDGVYVASCVWQDGKWQIAFASETENTGKTIRIDADSLKEQVMLEGPGGCMGVIQVPEMEGNFLTIEKFFPVFKSEDAQIVWNAWNGKTYDRKVIELLPFVHRIDIVRAYGEYYLIACSLCKKKDFIDDWSTSGSIYVGKLDLEKKYVIDFRPILDHIFQNHGFTKVPGEIADKVLIAGKAGIIEIKPVKKEEGIVWEAITLLDEPSSDVVITDIDGDGEPEYGVITPFHGEKFRIYKRNGEKLDCIYELPGEHEFGHAIYGGTVNGKNLFLAGFRAGGKELYAFLQEKDKEIRAEIVDEGKGPANVTVVSGKKEDYICAANRQSNLCTVYKMKQPQGK